MFNPSTRTMPGRLIAVCLLFLLGGWQLSSQEAKPPVTGGKGPTDKEKHDRPADLLRTMAGQLHNDAVMHFITTRGMGFARMGPTARIVKRDWKNATFSQKELEDESPVTGAKDLSMIHLGGLKLFGDSITVPRNKRVVWNEDPKAKKEKLWELKSFDLIGLVMHDGPVVYVSETAPEMKDLKDTPTRALDSFEQAGLERLVKGDKIFMRSKDDTIRVLGPIAAGKACLKCHGDYKEGDLLGAFSYTIREGQYELVDFRGKVVPPKK